MRLERCSEPSESVTVNSRFSMDRSSSMPLDCTIRERCLRINFAGSSLCSRDAIVSRNRSNAHHWYAELLMDTGRFDESVRESYKAKDLDPLSALMNTSVAGRLCTAGRCEEAMPHVLAALELDPDLPLAHVDLATIYTREGKFAEAIAEAKKAVLLSNNNPNFVADLGYVYAVSGDRKHTTEVLSPLQKTSKTRYVAPYQFAVVYSALGAKQKSLGALRKAFEERSPFLNNLYADTLPGGRLAGLRKQAELSRLLHAIRLPEPAEWSADIAVRLRGCCGSCSCGP